MKTKARKLNGFVTIPMVTAIGIIIIFGMTMLFKSSLLQNSQMVKDQLLLDYQHREEAILRAIVAIFPKKAIACMQGNYAVSNNYSWNSIFTEAISVACADQSLPTATRTAMGLTTQRFANVGDNTSANVISWITSLTGTSGNVTAGTTDNAAVFAQSQFAGKVPPLLSVPSNLTGLDSVQPCVSTSKVYATQATGLLADITVYPQYNIIPYPPIRFSYGTPGQPIVAKKHWWAFSIHYGALASQPTLPSSVTKYYILSLYEIPSQLPIEGAAVAEIGQYGNGTAWNSLTNVSGGVYANGLVVDATFGVNQLAGRSSIQMNNSVTLNGTQVSGNFDALGQREQLQASANNYALPVALSANSGRVVFFPLNTGSAFLTKSSSTLTSWDTYLGGANGCQVLVQAIAMVSQANQTPTSIRVTFQKSNGTTGTVILTRNSNWPLATDAGGATMPFQTELTNTNRSALTFCPSLLNAWIVSQGGASVATNNSIYFNTDPTSNPSTVNTPSSPPLSSDMTVVIRQGVDLTSFTNGISIVTPCRVYIGDDLNATPAAAPPTGSGLASSTTYYPSMSIFAAEMRIGTTAWQRPMDHHGQVGTLLSGSSTNWKPLDIKSGTDDTIQTSTMSVNLNSSSSPAQVPPVHLKNWLVIIEEIPQN